jgi:transposase-like protein
MSQQFDSSLNVPSVFSDEQKCVDYFAAVRFKNGLHCPHCRSNRKVHKFSDNVRYKCADCRKQFTVKVGTIFEESKIPLQKWFATFYLITSNEKGVSSLQLSRDITVTQKTAWFMLQRIRHIAETKSFNAPLEKSNARK